MNSDNVKIKSDRKLDTDLSCSNEIDIIGSKHNTDNNINMKGENDESMPSFGFSQEQVACVCEVKRKYISPTITSQSVCWTWWFV